MADGALTRAAARPAARPRALPVALRVAIVYIAARVLTTGMLALAAHLSGPTSRFGADATVGSLSMGWDAQWYLRVATAGYPVHLPTDAAGEIVQNAWAFLPVYPWLSRAVGFAFGYPAGAITVAVVAGYLACLALHRLLRDRLDETATMWAVVLFAAGPLGALFQLGYAESLFLLWLFLALRTLDRRRYGRLYPLIPLLGYTRPGVLAFALLIGLYALVRWVRRRSDPLPVREIAHLVALATLATLVGFSWQLIAGAVTGNPSAYLATELSWRRGWLDGGGDAFIPFRDFVCAAGMWFRLWGLPEAAGYVALAVAVLAVAATLLFEPHVRRLGVVVRLWCASYLVYLLAVFFPQSSLFRLLLPLSPLTGALAAPRSTAWRIAMLALGVVGQWWWIHEMLAVGNTYYQIP